MTMKRVKGIWLPASDTHFEDHLNRSELFEGRGTYQFSKLQLAVSHTLVSQRKLAVDIGAHVGLWSRVLSYMFDDVVSFEPNTELYECLVSNTRNLGNVDAWNKGLADKPGELKFQYVPDNSGNTCVSDTGTPVMCLTLDSFEYDNVSFIKIDTEGYELPILKGATETIKRCKPVIIVEQKPGNAERYGMGKLDAVHYLHKLGMKTRNIKAGDYILTF